jgi:hypothetical protein
MEAYNAKSESMTLFIEQCCDTGDGEEVSLQTFTKYYKAFAKKSNISAVSDGQIRHMLVKEYFFPVRQMKVMGLSIRKQARVTLLDE